MILDHLVVTAPTLQTGVAWIERVFGVTMNPGGQHPRMGTHNALLRIGERQYLEVIAVDPTQAAPNRERWFGLDHLPPTSNPKFATWIARTESIENSLHATPWKSTCVEPMSRGTLHWSITIPAFEDWQPVAVVPHLIQWGDDRHPTDNLPKSNVQLLGLHLQHPDAILVRQLMEQDLQVEKGAQLSLKVGPQLLRAEFQTPQGDIELCSS